MESLFANMKQEELYRSKYRSQREFKECVAAYIDFYNTRRPHSFWVTKRPSNLKNTILKKSNRTLTVRNKGVYRKRTPVFRILENKCPIRYIVKKHYF